MEIYADRRLPKSVGESRFPGWKGWERGMRLRAGVCSEIGEVTKKKILGLQITLVNKIFLSSIINKFYIIVHTVYILSNRPTIIRARKNRINTPIPIRLDNLHDYPIRPSNHHKYPQDNEEYMQTINALIKDVPPPVVVMAI